MWCACNKYNRTKEEEEEKEKKRIDLPLCFSLLDVFFSLLLLIPLLFFFFFLMIDKRLMEQKVFVCVRRMTIDRESKLKMSLSICMFPVMNY